MLLFWSWIVGQSDVRQWKQARAANLAAAEPLQRDLLGGVGQMVVMMSEPNLKLLMPYLFFLMSRFSAVNVKNKCVMRLEFLICFQGHSFSFQTCF